MKRKYRIASTSASSDKRRHTPLLLLEGRQRVSPEVNTDEADVLTKSHIDVELAKMRSMTPEEAAAAARAVADAEAEEAAREVEAAEADAEAAQAFAEAAMKALKGRSIPRMMIQA